MKSKQDVFLEPNNNNRKKKKRCFIISTLCFSSRGPSEWQPLSHQNQGVSRSCFTAPKMLAYPLAYIISPAALWGGENGGKDNHEEGSGFAGRQVVKFPLAGLSLPPSGWPFSTSWGLTVDQASRGRLRSCQLRQQPLFPCVPADWPKGHRDFQEACAALLQRAVSSHQKKSNQKYRAVAESKESSGRCSKWEKGQKLC